MIVYLSLKCIQCWNVHHCLSPKQTGYNGWYNWSASSIWATKLFLNIFCSDRTLSVHWALANLILRKGNLGENRKWSHFSVNYPHRDTKQENADDDCRKISCQLKELTFPYFCSPKWANKYRGGTISWSCHTWSMIYNGCTHHMFYSPAIWT